MVKQERQTGKPNPNIKVEIEKNGSDTILVTTTVRKEKFSNTPTAEILRKKRKELIKTTSEGVIGMSLGTIITYTAGYVQGAIGDSVRTFTVPAAIGGISLILFSYSLFDRIGLLRQQIKNIKSQSGISVR